MRIRIATFNIRNGIAFDWPSLWWTRRRSTLASIAGLDADIVALQEAYGFQWRWLQRRLGLAAVGARGRDADGGGESCAILVDPARVSALEGLVRWFGDEPDRPGSELLDAGHPRISSIATLARDGVAFTVANTHLDERHADNRRRSLEQLVSWVGEGPAIVVGDLNATPDAAELEPLVAHGFARVVAPGEADGTSHGFRGDTHLIDHCFLSPHWRVIAARIDRSRPHGRFPSDHWPIVVDLAID